MNIGFDLDKIFINYPPFIPGLLIEKLYKEKSNGTLLYRIPSKIEQKIRQLSHYHLLRPAIKENIEIAKTIITKKNNTYYLISSRFAFLEKQTDTVIKKYKLNTLFTGMFFNINNQQPHIFKDEMMKKLHIDKYVDDDLPLLKYLANHNPNIHFYWLNNKKKNIIQKNITAITGISQMEI